MVARLLCAWDSSDKNTGVGCHSLFQGLFPTQGSNPDLLHWQVDCLPLSHQESPVIYSLKAMVGGHEFLPLKDRNAPETTEMFRVLFWVLGAQVYKLPRWR